MEYKIKNHEDLERFIGYIQTGLEIALKEKREITVGEWDEGHIEIYPARRYQYRCSCGI